MRVLALLSISTGLFQQLNATPVLSFPIDAQIPPVGRVSRPFTFQFAATTFTSSDSSPLVYALSQAPSWLSLDSGTRCFYGTPAIEDLGVEPFGLVATDDSGSVTEWTNFTIVSTQAPRLTLEVSQILAESGRLSSPTSLILLPGSPFAIVFPNTTFTAPTALSYLATSANRSPLPSWITFDPNSLTFTGNAPTLVETPQTYGLTLIASDVEGFSGATVMFDIIVAQHELYFELVEQDIDQGKELNTSYTSLKDQLMLDAKTIPDELVASASARAPPWLQFDPVSFAITGHAPPGTVTANVYVEVRDIYGDTARTAVRFHFSSLLFNHEIGTITIVAGSTFSRSLAGNIARPEVHASVHLGAAGRWLQFNQTSFLIHGSVPRDISDQTIPATITLTSGSFNVSESQTFNIRIVDSSSNIDEPTATHSNIIDPTTSTYPRNLSNRSRSGSTNLQEDIAVPVGLFAGLFIVGICICCCWRRRKRKLQEVVPTAFNRLVLCCPKRRKKEDYLDEDSVETQPEPLVTSVARGHQICCSSHTGDMCQSPSHQQDGIAGFEQSRLSRPPGIDVPIGEPSSGVLDGLFTYLAPTMPHHEQFEELPSAPPRDSRRRSKKPLESRTSRNSGRCSPSRDKNRRSSTFKHRSGLPVTRRCTGLGHGHHSSADSTHSRLYSRVLGGLILGEMTSHPSTSVASLQRDSLPSRQNSRKVSCLLENATDPARRAAASPSNTTSFERRRQSYFAHRCTSARIGTGLNPLFNSMDLSRDSSYAWRIPLSSAANNRESSTTNAARVKHSNRRLTHRELTRSKSSSLRALPVDYCSPIREATRSTFDVDGSNCGWETASSSYSSRTESRLERRVPSEQLEDHSSSDFNQLDITARSLLEDANKGAASAGQTSAGASENRKSTIRRVESCASISQIKSSRHEREGEGFPVLNDESPTKRQSTVASGVPELSGNSDVESPVFL